MTISQFRNEKSLFLANSPRLKQQKNFLLDIDCILSHFLHKDRTWILTHDDTNLEEIVDEKTLFQIEDALNLRSTGLPVAYITGKKEFYGIDFFVNKNVLIPKPDTEILVEKALELIKENNFKTIADICTGSGCIGIAIAKNMQNRESGTGKISECDEQFFLTDVSHLALEVAQENAKTILGENYVNGSQTNATETNAPHFSFLLGEFLWPLIENEDEKIRKTRFDIIVTNPPYIPRIMVNELLRDGRNEPILALDGDASYTNPIDENYGDGLSIIRPIVSQSFEKLKSGGFFLCETGEYNSSKTVGLCKISGFSEIQVLNDLEGNPRVVMAKKI